MLIFVGIGLTMLWVEKRFETKAKDACQPSFSFFQQGWIPKLTAFLHLFKSNAPRKTRSL